jgi:hypothetical protein
MIDNRDKEEFFDEFRDFLEGYDDMALDEEEIPQVTEEWWATGIPDSL